jgi:hypothetical protein
MHQVVTPPRRWSLVYLDQPYPLGAEPLVIGRGHDCDVVVDDVTVSRRHCTVVLGMRGPILHDAGSRHGTRLNGEPVTAPSPLVHGDRIVVGGAVLVLRDTTSYARAEARTQETRRSQMGRTQTREEVTGEIDPLVAAVADVEQRAAGGGRPSAGTLGTIVGIVARRHGLPEAVLQHAAVTVLRAAIGGPHAFVDDVVRLFAARGVVMGADTVDAIVLSVGHGGEVDRVLLLAYVAQIERAFAGQSSAQAAHCVRLLRAVAESV